jgi:glycosyltransferase involved in cell wall biosynthesis
LPRRPIKLALFAASSFYHQAPLYRLIAQDPRIDFTAFFASNEGLARPYDGGYQGQIVWDIDALSGFRHVFLPDADRTLAGGPFLTIKDLSIVRLLREGNYDVLWLHGYNFLSHVSALVSHRLRGGKLLLRDEQTLLHGRPFFKSIIRALALRTVLSQAHGLYIGTENRRWFRHYGVPADRLFFTPYCVDNERFRADATQLAGLAPELRRSFGIADDASPVILSVSRLIEKKQPQLLLEAFRRVRAGRRCVLLLVGTGELETALRQQVAANAIPDIVFAGFLNQSGVSKAYACADIFALVSREHETWGLVVNEAMNFALPIVVSNKVGSATDLVEEGGNGFVVDRDSVETLAARLAELVDEPSLRASFGARSVEIVQGWTYDVTARGILDATKKAVGAERWQQAEVDAAVPV